MEGFGQRASSRSELSKQTWAGFHGRVGRDGDRQEWGQGTFLGTGWGGAAVPGPSAGREGRVWGQEQGEWASSPLEQLQLLKGLLGKTRMI